MAKTDAVVVHEWVSGFAQSAVDFDIVAREIAQRIHDGAPSLEAAYLDAFRQHYGVDPDGERMLPDCHHCGGARMAGNKRILRNARNCGSCGATDCHTPEEARRGIAPWEQPELRRRRDG